MPVAPEEGFQGNVTETIDGIGERALEGEAAHLAVGDDVQAGVLLEFDGRIHRPVLDLLEGRRRDLSGYQVIPGLEQLGRPQQAADDVGVGRDHGHKRATGGIGRGQDGFRRRLMAIALPFENRARAGRLLAAQLAEFRGRPDVLVLELPRGGVPVAFEAAQDGRAFWWTTVWRPGRPCRPRSPGCARPAPKRCWWRHGWRRPR